MKIEKIKTRIGEFERNIKYPIRDIIGEIYKIKGEYDLFPYVPWLGKEMLKKILEQDLIYTKNLIIILDDCNHKPLIFTFTDGHYIIFENYQKNNNKGINEGGYILTNIYKKGKPNLHEILNCF